MIVHLGLHVDGWQGPSGAPRLGAPVLGPRAFLGLLETHLGLSGPAVPRARRLAAYLGALRAVDGPQRFFHASLQADEIGAAALLLAWRDEWMLSGWDGRGRADWPDRLQDMASVECVAAGKIPAGDGERLRAIAERLSRRRTPLTRVQLLDPLDQFPLAWQQVLQRLPTAAPAEPAVIAAGQLGQVQAACLRALSGAALEPVRADEDGSLQVYQPLGGEAAEHWLSSKCRADSAVERLLVCEQQGASIDETLRVSGVAMCGFDEHSELRPALQALPLALEMLWKPLEPAHVLAFLMHPIGPFSGAARRQLARAFAAQPGIGGAQWAAARERIAQDEGGQGHLAELAFWLEGQRFDRGQGAPIDSVIERLERLQQAVQARMQAGAHGAGEELGAALTQCDGMVAALLELRGHGMQLLRPRLLQQLTTQASTSAGCALAVAQAGCMQSATSPAACVEEAQEVIWWMPGRPALPAPHPWTGKELAALAEAGVTLRDPAAEMAAMGAQWLRPILKARERLVLVLPPPGGEEHPAWQLLQRVCSGFAVRPLETLLDDGIAVPAVPRRLPAPRGRWALDPNAAWRAGLPQPTRRPEQSYSSLSELFANPAVAVLKDAAALRPGTTYAVDDGNRLLGTLAHRLVERLFSDQRALQWTASEVSEWFAPNCMDLLRREGTPLLARGNAMQLQGFMRAAEPAIVRLLEHLRHARAERVYPERALKGAFPQLSLAGNTDLLVQLAGGGTVALDLKWSRAGRFHQQLLDADFLQLALYAAMIEQELGRPPVAIGYFTLLDATLLTLTPGLFAASARVVAPRGGSNAAEQVAMARASWEWRVQQWRSGEIEVIGAGFEPPPSDPPTGCLPLREPSPFNAEFTSLFGIQESA